MQLDKSESPPTPPSTQGHYVRAEARLQLLPPVFALSGLRGHAKWSRDQTSLYLHDWTHRGLVERLGGRSGVYFNLVRDPRGRSQHLAAAIALAMPTAVALDFGWAGNKVALVAGELWLAVQRRGARYSLDGVKVVSRGRRWYRRVASGIDRTGSLARLHPEWTLAEVLLAPEWRETELEEAAEQLIASYEPSAEFTQAYHALMPVYTTLASPHE